ncbi:MAG TPA: polysaccharide deacetylase family protein [Longimicrobiaceae bacterium]|nr:polysaccharide deacetylase family protein [Longimicrobiaceae bacterium]
MPTELRLGRLAAVVAVLGLALAACGGSDDEGAGEEKAAAPADSAAADSAGGAQAEGGGAVPDDGGPKTDLPPNELGRIPVLEYHRIGDNEGEFVRSLANFRRDLQSLYDAGYRPILMRDVLRGNINVPAGTTPVVFTFDDATQGQFYYRPDGSLDPNTMMGSWVAFKERNPGWRNGGVWCILPAAQHPSNFFGETKDRDTPREQREANIRKKMEFLVQNGHEVCNHTWYHARLDRARDDAQVQEYIGVGEDSIKTYLPPDYDIVTFALPLGQWPDNRQLAWRGTYRDGKTYEYEVVLEVSGGPNVSPFDTAWNGHSVDRFIVAPGALEGLLRRWQASPERFVSDGDPSTVTYPASRAGRLDRSRLGGRTPRELPDAPAAQRDTPAPAAPPGGR